MSDRFFFMYSTDHTRQFHLLAEKKYEFCARDVCSRTSGDDMAFVFETVGDSRACWLRLRWSGSAMGGGCTVACDVVTHPQTPEFWFTYCARLLSLYKHTTTSNSARLFLSPTQVIHRHLRVPSVYN